MSAVHRKELFPATTIATDTTTLGASFGLENHNKVLVIKSTVSDRTDGTYTLSLSTSDTKAFTASYVVKATSAQSADGSVYAELDNTTEHCLQYVRASILSSSTSTGAKVQVEIFYQNRK